MEFLYYAFAVAVSVVLLVAYWRIFTKAGQPGWTSLIPIYNVVKLLHITGRSGWWVLWMFVPVVNAFIGVFLFVRLVFDLARVFGRGVGFGFGLLFLSPIFIPILAFGDARYVGRAGRPAAT